MQPLLHLSNKKIRKAIEDDDLQHVKILFDVLFKMGSVIEQAETRYAELKTVTSTNSDEEYDPTKQVLIMKEEDLSWPVYDAFHH